MNDEIDDNAFFQQDFTTASDWELFNARLEEIFHGWKLSFVEPGDMLTKNQLFLCSWDVSSETVFFADVELEITRYCAILPESTATDLSKSKDYQVFADLMSLNSDFCIVDEKYESDIHPLTRWYGLRDFVVVSPKKSSIINKSQIRILLSSIHIAVAESNCEIPVFVQALEKKQHVYLGLCENRSTRMSFDIVHLQTTPPTCKYLSGLLDMFKGKIGVRYVDPVTVSVRLTFSLTKFLSTSFVSERKYAFNDQDEEDDADDVPSFLLPFGVPIDPVKELVLYSSWPQVAENVVIDSQTYTDFDALSAPFWSLRCRFEPTPVCFMSECITEYLQLCDSRKKLTELLGSGFEYGGSSSFESNPLDQLTESKISKVMPSFKTKSVDLKKPHTLDGPLSEEQCMQMLYYMFPDAETESRQSYKIEDNDQVSLKEYIIRNIFINYFIYSLIL